MGDPVTMAVIGGTIGAAMSPKDPLKGAMLGAVGGYGGGAALGAMGGTTAGTAAAGAMPSAAAGGVAGTAGTAGLSAAGGTLAPSLGASLGAGGSTIGTGSVGLSAGTGSVGLTAPSAMTGIGITPATAASPSLLSSIGTFAQQNPELARMTLGTGMQALTPQETQVPPAGLMRGNPNQMQQSQYQFAPPRSSLI